MTNKILFFVTALFMSFAITASASGSNKVQENIKKSAKKEAECAKCTKGDLAKKLSDNKKALAKTVDTKNIKTELEKKAASTDGIIKKKIKVISKKTVKTGVEKITKTPVTEPVKKTIDTGVEKAVNIIGDKLKK